MFKTLKEINKGIIFTNTEQKGIYQKRRKMKHRGKYEKKFKFGNKKIIIKKLNIYEIG